MKNGPGTFVVVDGMDGSGKSTVIEMLKLELIAELFDVVTTREIGGTPIAEALRKLCFQTRPDEPLNSSAQTLMAFAARLQHTEHVILPAVQSGKLVLSDRYSSSTHVYQGILRREKALVNALESEFKGCGMVLDPDIYIYLNPKPEIAYARGVTREGLDNDAFKKNEQQARAIHAAYEVVFSRIRQQKQSTVLEIDTGCSMEELREKIKAVAKAIAAVSAIRVPAILMQQRARLNALKF